MTVGQLLVAEAVPQFGNIADLHVAALPVLLALQLDVDVFDVVDFGTSRLFWQPGSDRHYLFVS